MKPYIHAKNSVRKWGGKISDYLPIHNEMDLSKSAMPDVRHRVIYHTSFGIYIIEKIFGEVITNSEGREVSVRDIAEQHVIEDLGFIPTLENYLQFMSVQDWMIRPAVRKQLKQKNDQDKNLSDTEEAINKTQSGQDILNQWREEGRVVELSDEEEAEKRKKFRKFMEGNKKRTGSDNIRYD